MQPVKSASAGPRMHAGEVKAEAISRAAKEIIRADNMARDAQMQRLRAARLAHEAEQQALAAAAPPPAPKASRARR